MSKLEKIKRTRDSENDRKSRVESLKKFTGLKLNSYNTSSLDSRSVSGNIENFIGTISVPVGFAGPLLIRFNKHDSQEIIAPLATTEGALVSSVQRGSLAINLSGGVTVRTLSSKMIRAPQYEFDSIDTAIEFTQWVSTRNEILKSLVKDKSNHAKLLEIDSKVFGRTVHLRFVYSTGNAAGQNMTTFCTSYLCQFINEKFAQETGHKILSYIIEGNLSSDKKASVLSAIEGRGHSVIAETLIKGAVLKKILKITPESLYLNFTRSKSARMYTGMIGFNINVANIVAAMFLATGQDMACIHESSIAELHMEPKGDDLYVSLMMPSLVVGTIGGGTQLPAFRENIEMLGCYQVANSADRLAEVIASFALALELSTVSAVGGGQFVEAHEVFGRNLLKAGLNIKEIDEEFFKKSLSDETISRVNKIEGKNKQGFVTDIAQQVSKKHTGMYAYEIQSKMESKKAFLKIKAHDREIVLGSAKVLEVLNPGIAELLIKRSEHLPFKNCHLREIEILSKRNILINEIAPSFLGSFVDFNKEAFVLIQEMIESHWNVSEILNLELWTDQLKKEVIYRISKLHKSFLNEKDKIQQLAPTIIEMASRQKIDEQIDLWDALFTLNYSRLKNNYPALFKLYEQTLENFDQIMKNIQQRDQTLIHYDLNPRNIAFNNQNHIKIFDWEFAAQGLPQRDLIEFILFVCIKENIKSNLDELSKFHFQQIYNDSGNWEVWQEGVFLSLQEFIAKRLPFYFILAELSFCPYIDRLLGNIEEIISLFPSYLEVRT